MDEEQYKTNPRNKVATFEDLEVWQMARQVRKELYQILKSLPDEERYNLTSQMRRAAVSLTANIAEGYGRFHFKENIQCCRIARGSAYELIDHLITCQDQRLLSDQQVIELRGALFSVIRLLNGYIRSIAAQAKKADEF
jgi:four helix bundle protein